MRNYVFVFVIALLSISSAAQTFWTATPRSELTVGYSLAYAAAQQKALNGFAISGTQNFNKWVGLNTEFAAYYGADSATVSSFPVVASATLTQSIYSFGAGPQFALHRYAYAVPFVRGMVGVVNQRFSGSVSASSVVPGFGNVSISGNTSLTGVALGGGGGTDIRVTRNAGIRLAVDYVRTHLGDAWQNNVRITTGLTFRFGQLGASLAEDNAPTNHEPNSAARPNKTRTITALGITGFDDPTYGFKILSVLSNSPAESARIAVGDYVVAVGGKPVKTADEITAALSGDTKTFKIGVLRRYWQYEMPVTLD